MRTHQVVAITALLSVLPLLHASAAPTEAVQARVSAWEAVLQSLPAHPLASQALDDIVAAYGGERCAALAALTREYADEDLGVFAAEQLHRGCTEIAPRLAAELSNTRAGARLAALGGTTQADLASRAGMTTALAELEAKIDAGANEDALSECLRLGDAALALGGGVSDRWCRALALLPERTGLGVLTDFTRALLDMPGDERSIALAYLTRLLKAGAAIPQPTDLPAVLGAMQGSTPAAAFAALQALGLCGVAHEGKNFATAISFLAAYRAEDPWDTRYTLAIARGHAHALFTAAKSGPWGRATREAADRLTQVLVEQLEDAPEESGAYASFAERCAGQYKSEFRFLGEARTLRLLLASAHEEEKADTWRKRLAEIESGVWRNHAEAARLTRARWAGHEQDRAVLDAVMQEVRYLYLADDIRAAKALLQRMALAAPDESIRNDARMYEILCEFRYGDVERAKVLINDLMQNHYDSPWFFNAMLLRAYLLYIWGDEKEAAKACQQLAGVTLDAERGRKARELASDLTEMAARAQLPRAAPRSGAPNIVLISLDTTRADRLGCYGNSAARTPNLDELASLGTVFEHAYSTSSWTKPAHASVFTGRYPKAHGAENYDDQIAPQAGVVPEWLRDAGYQTMGIVSAPPLNSIFGFGRGFDIYDDHFYELDRVCDLFLRGGGGAVKIHNGATATLVTHAAMLMYNRRVKGEQPWFFFVNYFDAHHNYLPVFPHNQRDREAYFGSEWGVIDPYAGGEKPRDPTAANLDLDRLLALYDDEIANVDAQVGTWIYRARAAGKFDNTIFVIFGDHGEEFLEHGNLAHGNGLANEVLHVPFILCGPGVPKGKRISAPVSLVDIAPTLMALAGEKAPEGLDGVDLGPVIRGDAPMPERPLIASLNLPAFQGYTVLRGDDKAVVDTKGKHYSLFDLAVDPDEQDDLATRAGTRLNELVSIGARKQDELRQTGLSLGSGVPVSRDGLPTMGALVEQLKAMGYLGK